jgi:hypothetical protein
MKKEFITHEPESKDNWVCICGNTPTSEGFDPCDAEGNQIAPTIASGWTNLYVCDRCGRVIRQDTLEVIGRNPKAKVVA